MTATLQTVCFVFRRVYSRNENRRTPQDGYDSPSDEDERWARKYSADKLRRRYSGEEEIQPRSRYVLFVLIVMETSTNLLLNGTAYSEVYLVYMRKIMDIGESFELSCLAPKINIKNVRTSGVREIFVVEVFRLS